MAEYVAGSVIGLSSLREKDEAAKAPPPLSEAAKQRQEYLKRYLEGGADDHARGGSGKKKKKKRKKAAAQQSGSALRLVDEDVEWQAVKPVEACDELPAAAAGASEDEDDGALAELTRKTESLRRPISSARRHTPCLLHR
jgi:hypothetical protein